MTTAIVLIPVEYLNSRKKGEEIQNQTYKTTTALRIHLALELIREDDPEVEDGTEPSVNDVLIYDLTDYMDAVNNQELDVLTGYFMTYVNFE